MLLAELAKRRLEDLRRTPDEQADEDVTAIEEGGLREFFNRAWVPIGETDRLVENWHLDAIAEHLEAVSACEILRLLICIPPGHTKSLSVSVMWPAWMWIPTNAPETKFITASYSPNLSRRDALRVRNLIDSSWWEQRWPELYVPWQNTRSGSNYANNLGGKRLAVSPHGEATGHHADIHIGDDLINAMDTENSGGVPTAELEYVETWWTKTMASRASNPATLRRVLMMQRLHELDIAGWAIRDGSYEVLSLPTRYEIENPSRTYHFVEGERKLFFEDPRTEEGELLNPDRFPEEVVSELEKPGGMGEDAFAAQHQQRPVSKKGSIFKEHWFLQRYDALPRGGQTILSVDARFIDSMDKGDFVAIGVWKKVFPNYYLVDQLRERLSFTESLHEILKMIARHPTCLGKLIEYKANGPAICDMLKTHVDGLIRIEPNGSKESRARATTALFEAGNVLFPRDDAAPWMRAYVEEMKTFPRGRNDDQVDQTTQALLYLHDGAEIDHGAVADILSTLRRRR